MDSNAGFGRGIRFEKPRRRDRGRGATPPHPPLFLRHGMHEHERTSSTSPAAARSTSCPPLRGPSPIEPSRSRWRAEAAPPPPPARALCTALLDEEGSASFSGAPEGRDDFHPKAEEMGAGGGGTPLAGFRGARCIFFLTHGGEKNLIFFIESYLSYLRVRTTGYHPRAHTYVQEDHAETCWCARNPRAALANLVREG